MLRILLTQVIPVLLPILLYLAWLHLSRRRAAAAGHAAPGWHEAPWAWIIGSGLLVMIVGMILLSLFTGEQPGGTYVPARVEDGVLVPGRIER